MYTLFYRSLGLKILLFHEFDSCWNLETETYLNPCSYILMLIGPMFR